MRITGMAKKAPRTANAVSAPVAGESASERIRARILASGQRFNANDNIAAFIEPGELDEWLQRDPINILKDRMIADGQLDEVEYEELRQAAETAVVDAIEWAKNEPFPALESLYADVYYEG